MTLSRFFSISWSLVLVFSLLSAGAHAAETTPSDVEPSNDQSQILTLRTGQNDHRLSLSDIEAQSLHDVEMKHLEGPEGRFTGVWLDQLLERYGISEEDRIRLIAWDGYTVFLDAEERRARRYLLVTRLNGSNLTRDEHGPLLLVVPEEAEAVLSGRASLARWIWSIRSIHQQ